MRIGIFDPYLDDLGGGEKYMLKIALCLAKRHKVDVFWDREEDLKKLQERFLLDLSLIKRVKNIFAKEVNFLKRLTQSSKYDVIIFLSDGSIPFVLSRKLFVHIQQPLSTFPLDSIKNKIKLSRVNAFFFNSNFTKSFINLPNNKKTVVIYPPIELFPKEVKKENIILHVGRFRVKNVNIGDYKKQDLMIEEFKKMVQKGLSNWRFVLAVSVLEKDKETFEGLKKKANGFPVEFLINNDNKKLWDIYNRSKIYWHATGFGEDLQKYPEYAEHFGISTVEAMGAGAVPVVINAGGQKEIVIDSENGFLWNTLEEFQEKTLELIKDEKLLETMSKNAKERAESFAGDRFCKEVLNLVENE